ncbi:MAG TPA: UDP-N-acetylglucosamine 2-epimerase (non-hydrolyzing) [Bacteroidia bacterium]|nr:UDP-N-acetylglucosamine 2-epimerase (non-hydrolyzing) [Bacteroidia bacterium]
MLKILTVIGARPQIIKAAALSRTIRLHFSGQITELIVHTGQHYDENMSQVFFDEMGIPAPHYNLNVGSGTHGGQTAAMISGLEKILLEEKPHALVLYGDTNSTLAGAVAASKLHIPVVHIEAGLRSFNKSMPEEINRVLCDHVSTLLFSPTKAGFDHLVNEGVAKKQNPVRANADAPAVYHCGDIMYDNSLYFGEIASEKTDILQREKLQSGKFLLATVHRDNNTDIAERLFAIFTAFDKLSKAKNIPVVLPLHPRTKKNISQHPSLQKMIDSNPLIRIVPPASFFEMIVLEKNALLVVTDSGGVQKEAFFFRKPCVILRPETEWVELVECGAAILADADESRILSATEKLLSADIEYPALFGDGHAAEFMCKKMLEHLS